MKGDEVLRLVLRREIAKDFCRLEGIFIEDAKERMEAWPEWYSDTLVGFLTALNDSWEQYVIGN